MNGFNLSNIQGASLGAASLSSIYLGSIKLWESDPQLSEYFWIKCTSAGNMELKVNGTLSDFSIQISNDKNSWNTYTFNSSNKSYSFGASTNTTYYIKGINSNYATSTSNYFNIKCTSGSFTTGGNIMSLIYGDNFQGQKTLSSNYVFNSLFKGNTKLTSAYDLRLPATSITRYGYQYMFNGCTTLTAIPQKIPATYVDYYAMDHMFSGCTALNDVPDLSSITRVNGYVFANMFSGCTSLTVLPDFHNVGTIEYWAPWRYTFQGCTSIQDARWNKNGSRLLPDHLTVTGGGSAYELMFNGCTGLIYAPELTETNPHTGEFNNMFNGCTNSRFINIYTHGSSLGTNYYADIVKGTGHSGTIWKADDVSWDSSQYSQFNYSGSGSTASRWIVYAASYNSGEYQT